MTRAIKTPLASVGKPFVIEFAGTPNVGKDTQIEILSDYLQDYRGLRVSIIGEVYRDSKIIKDHIARLHWVLAKVIQNLSELKDSSADVIIVNRGLFDVLVFFNYYYRRGYMKKKEFRVISSLITSGTLCDIEDLIIVMQTNAEVAIHREKVFPGNTIFNLSMTLDGWNPDPTPTITHQDGLVLLNKCYDEIIARFGNSFKRTYRIVDDGNKSIDDVALEVGSHLHSFLPQTKDALHKATPSAENKSRNQEIQLSFPKISGDEDRA